MFISWCHPPRSPGLVDQGRDNSTSILVTEATGYKTLIISRSVPFGGSDISSGAVPNHGVNIPGKDRATIKPWTYKVDKVHGAFLAWNWDLNQTRVRVRDTYLQVLVYSLKKCCTVQTLHGDLLHWQPQFLSCLQIHCYSIQRSCLMLTFVPILLEILMYLGDRSTFIFIQLL